MIVIPLKYQPSHEELRYCLRAIEQHHPEQEVMIVGHLPNWITNIIHLEHGDYSYPYKDRSIYEKIVAAFRYTDKMLFFNDDHIILSLVNYVHHKGPMNPNARDPLGSYTKLLQNTIARFGPVNDYDTHCPIWYEKEMFAKLADLDWKKEHGYGIKTSYCVMNGIEGTYYPDLKFRHTIGNIENRLYFSTDDNCNLNPLKALLPNRSKFERK